MTVVHVRVPKAVFTRALNRHGDIAGNEFRTDTERHDGDVVRFVLFRIRHDNSSDDRCSSRRCGVRGTADFILRADSRCDSVR